jgi:hypothetical protein
MGIIKFYKVKKLISARLSDPKIPLSTTISIPAAFQRFVYMPQKEF